MVKELHAAGIEVILDVVYNHTAEGDHTGPTLSFKGIDNPGYYRLDGGNRARYTDYTGCGNTLDVRRPAGAARCSWTRCATGSPRCTSTGSASTSPRRWPGRCTTSTGCRRSSTSSTRTRWSARSS